MALALIVDLLRLLRLTFRSRARLAAENLFLRKQLACYVERKVRPQGADNASRVALVLLSRFVAWRELLTHLARCDCTCRTLPARVVASRRNPGPPSSTIMRVRRFADGRVVTAGVDGDGVGGGIGSRLRAGVEAR